MANIRVPLPTMTPVFIERISPAFKYENQKRTDRRVTDAEGRPVSRVTVFGLVLDQLGSVQIEAPDSVVQDLADGDVVIPKGSRVEGELRGGDFGAVNVKIQGVDHFQRIASAAEVLDQLGKSVAAKGQ